jgi:hypothetical protein
MSGHVRDAGGSSNEAWPALPWEAWKDTCDTLHLWAQVVGKVKLELTPFLKECICIIYTSDAAD